MTEKITIDMLTYNNVSVKKQQYIIHDNIEYAIGLPWRKAYMNSEQGRRELKEEVPEPYQSVIFLMWGDDPTISDITE